MTGCQCEACKAPSMVFRINDYPYKMEYTHFHFYPPEIGLTSFFGQYSNYGRSYAELSFSCYDPELQFFSLMLGYLGKKFDFSIDSWYQFRQAHVVHLSNDAIDYTKIRLVTTEWATLK